MYSNNEKVLIWMSMFDGMTNTKAHKLLSFYPNPIDIFKKLIADGSTIKKVVGEEVYFKMLNIDNNEIKNYIQNLSDRGIKCVTILSEEYPEKLREIPDAPYILFCKGDVSLLFKRGIAIVGTRQPTAYARGVTEEFAKALAEKGLVIVSGLASGVDKISHETALKVGGRTIAVLAGGFNVIYPAMNTNLAKEIEEKGLLVTEYRPDVSATKFSFPNRNRIISAISDATLITEAGEKSGALHTKNFAIEQGKLVFAIPGNINNVKAVGSNKILKDMQGAMVLEPNDILLQMHIPLVSVYEKKEVKISQQQGDVSETLILKALQDGEQTLETLQEITKLETKTLNSCLTIMQIRGLIKKLPGNSYSI